MRIRVTGTMTTNPLGSQIVIGRAYGLTEGVADNSTLTIDPTGGRGEVLLPTICDGLFGYCSTAGLNMPWEVSLRLLQR